MSDDDIVVIVCAPWSEEQLMALPGNRTAECASCHDPVVLSRQGRQLIDAQGAVVRCPRCARREAPDASTHETPGAIDAAQRAGVPARHSRRMLGRPLRELIDEDGDWTDQ
jgi:hypothetical protein